ncbi:SusC/RagA family TonB-linked outer membrane protein [Chryseobacterium bernardetii]|uniref:SusC/RagA family TonB-linked outer membrane protein n=1 Tax=Chryseobacterium bernardetii TaxID=1241978 RepID=A0A3G6TDR8_9FLAO|nr:SusC/RagA family TonB-linked outer membrane protein [Chryseobacterium bernardetii]AZB25989.1 SusC/RagA family TonB-linked outer membrane protein [Chryseobacterium bernardetii]
MKNYILLPVIFCSTFIVAQQTVTGKITESTTGKPLSGVAVVIQNINAITNTDKNGIFKFTSPESQLTLIISKAGYESQSLDIQLPLQKELKISLSPKVTVIAEVSISTGYQKIPKERSTGSFSSVDNKLLQQQVTTNIMDRLPAIANGLTVSKGLTEDGQLMIRGLSTMQGPKNPLIVVDNFPYEGSISNINPNIIETVTILKDAAASSIWGARAANGVIVITTKAAKTNQATSVEFTANTTLSTKPDLSYSRQISSSDFIDVEMKLFNQGYYDTDINSASHPTLTPVVSILNKEKQGLLSHNDAMNEINRLNNIDVRDQYKRYMYQPMENRQYALNIFGSTPKLSWTSFIGYDDNTGNLSEEYQRLNARFQNIWKPTEKLTVTTGMYYTNTTTKSGRSAYNSITMRNNWKVPYKQFADDAGNPLVMNYMLDQDYKNSLQGTGLLDWNYYPLTDWMHNIVQNKTNEFILNAGLNYKIVKGLDLDIKYQYQHNNGESSTLYDEQSYYARNYVNNFAKKNTDGSISFIVPKGGIFDKGLSETMVNNLRGQLNYNRNFGKHSINAIAGGEIRETITQYDNNRYYGYNTNTLSNASIDYTNQHPNFVTGSLDFIERGTSLRETNIRFVSLYANAAYTYDKRYTLSGSVRQDASNLFGLKTNQQWNPFWSAGLSWNISNEAFYNFSFLPYLNLRGSYGFNGNIDPSMVAVTTILFDTDLSVYTGGNTARIDKFYNPDLRWETIKMMNIGLDFGLKNNLITGSIEYFTKEGSNLFGTAPLDYTTGVKSMLWNVAGMKGRGMDIELKTKNIDKTVKWNSIINFSIYNDKVTNYYLPTTFANSFVVNSGSIAPISGIVGLPVYGVFAYKWAGLDPQTGDPQGYLDGEVTKDYTKILNSARGIEDLEYFGSAIPTKYGSFINTIAYQQFSLDIGITYKFGYWFRRSSINYTDLIVSRDGHSDYSKRWQNPADELWTNVPSNPYTTNSARDAFYNGSSVLVERGDHIRLQYLTLNYSFRKENLANLPIQNLQLFASANNLGILWKANKAGIDPDYNWGTYSLKPVTTYSIGLRTQF